MKQPAIVISCEHAGNRVPAGLKGLFAGRERLLASHRGYDAGALSLAGMLARRADAPLHYCPTSRLAVDVNRSPGSPQLFSNLTRNLSPVQCERLLQQIHTPYRRRLRERIGKSLIFRGTVIHFSVHTFTPVLRGRKRTADIGLLYDPGRKEERLLARACRKAIGEVLPELKVRFNYPYRGKSDGIALAMRRSFPGQAYIGIELETNQRLVRGSRWPGIRRNIAIAITAALEYHG